MERFEAPRADSAILLYLGCVTAILGLFAWSFYGLMQPTVVPNLGLAKYEYKEPGHATIFSHKISVSMEDMERTAIAAAQHENEDQGIEPLRAVASVERAAANANTANTSSVTLPVAKPPKRAPPKRVARREVAPPPWRSWELAFRSNGWPGATSSRPLWADGRGHY